MSVTVPRLQRCDQLMKKILTGDISLVPTFVSVVIQYLSEGAPDITENRAEFVAHVSSKTNDLLNTLFLIVLDGPPLKQIKAPVVKHTPPALLVGFLTGLEVTRPVGVGLLVNSSFPHLSKRIPKEALLGACLVPFLDPRNWFLSYLPSLALGLSAGQVWTSKERCCS